MLQLTTILLVCALSSAMLYSSSSLHGVCVFYTPTCVCAVGDKGKDRSSSSAKGRAQDASGQAAGLV